MIAVRMMQVTVYQIIRVVAMWNGFVTAALSVDMARLVAAAVVLRCTRVGVRGVDGQHMFVNMIAVRMMQMPVVQVIRVPIMFHRRMAAASAVLMVMIGMRLAGVRLIGHGWNPREKANGDERMRGRRRISPPKNLETRGGTQRASPVAAPRSIC